MNDPVEVGRGIADPDEVLRMLTSVMRGRIREPVVVLEQKTGTAGKVEKAARVVEKRASVRERMSAAEMLARRYGILDGSDADGIEFVGEDKILTSDEYDEDDEGASED